MDETEVETVVRLQAVDVRDLFPDFSPEDAGSRVCLLCHAKLKDKTHNLTRHLERHHVGALLQLMEQRTAAPSTVVAPAARTPKAAATASSSRVRKQPQQEQAQPSKGHSQKQRRLVSPKSAKPMEGEETKTAAPPQLPLEMKPDQVENAKLALAKWLAQEQLPMSLVANDGFRQFVHSLNGTFEPPEHDELQQVLERMHTRHHQLEKENRTSESAADGDESKPKKNEKKKKQRVEKKIAIESKALVAVSRMPDDAPRVRYQQLACGVLQRGFVQVRVHLALASLADAMVCSGHAKGKQGVLGRSFVGIVEQVNQLEGSLVQETQRVALASSLLPCSLCALKTEHDLPSASSCCAHLQQHFGMSSSRGALSEYIELSEASLCVIPSAVPDDLALLVDDLAVVIRMGNVAKQRGMEKIAIVTDGVAGCLVGILTRYLSQNLGLTSKDVHIFATESMSEAQQGQLRQHATLGIYHSDTFDDVLSKQLAFDGVIDMCGNEASTEFAVRLVQPMGTLVVVDRGRFEHADSSNNTPQLAMDMNAVVVNELEIVSIGDCRAEAPEALAYLEEQALSSENCDALRAFLSAPVALGDALEELRRPEVLDLLKTQYLRVKCQAMDVEC